MEERLLKGFVAAAAGRYDVLLCRCRMFVSGGEAVTRSSAMEQAILNSMPRRFHDAPIDHTVACRHVDSGAIDRFSDCMSDKMGPKRRVYHEGTRGCASEREQVQ